MRIIAGVLGGRSLRAPKGLGTRPTTDRVREALFNLLVAREDPPHEVLDLYAGSGALGLEALSRGAERAVFVDEGARACDSIRANASELGVADHCQIARLPVHKWLARASGHNFGWIFLDPPYDAAGQLDGALRLLGEGALLAPGATVIAEHEWRSAPAERYGTLSRFDLRQYGQTGVSLFSSSAELQTT